MYGKHFASMYSGSMFGKPAIVFALWGYVIANMRPSRKDGECYVEINPTLLAATFATTVDAVTEALRTLESPDPASRTKRDDGRRLLLIGDERHAGPMQFRVVNGATYRATRDEDERREQNRRAKRAERTRKNVSNVSRRQPMSSQAEAETEVEVEAEATPKEHPLVGRPDRRDRAAAKDLVEGFTLTADLRRWAKANAPTVPVDVATEAWRDRMRENGYKTNQGPVRDPAASWRRAIRNAELWGTYRNQGAVPRKPAPFTMIAKAE